jgi:hypothetical protein
VIHFRHFARNPMRYLLALVAAAVVAANSGCTDPTSDKSKTTPPATTQPKDAPAKTDT